VGKLMRGDSSQQLAHNRAPAKQTRRNRDPWEEALLAAEDHPLRQFALQNDLAMIRHYDAQINLLEVRLLNLAKAHSGRDFALLQSVPGIGDSLGLTILHEIGPIERFPTVKDFLSYCRLVKGTVASAGKIKGLRGAKLGNPYLRWAFGEAAVLPLRRPCRLRSAAFKRGRSAPRVAKRDHAIIGPMSQRLEARFQGNKFKANTVLAIKLARAVYFMLKDKTVFDSERLIRAMTKT
jgi:transposase